MEGDMDFSKNAGNANVPDGMHQEMAPENFKAHLSGDEEVPSVDTKATGQTIFQLNKKDSVLHYKLIVANIKNVRMAHIHMAPAGENGGVVAWLYPSAPPPQLIEGQFQGVLAEGTVTADDLTGALGGASFGDLIEAIKAGNTYVNVHTKPRWRSDKLNDEACNVIGPKLTI